MSNHDVFVVGQDGAWDARLEFVNKDVKGVARRHVSMFEALGALLYHYPELFGVRKIEIITTDTGKEGLGF